MGHRRSASFPFHHPVRSSPCVQFDWLVREKVADGALIAKWRKPGYEILCSMLAIQKSELAGWRPRSHALN